MKLLAALAYAALLQLATTFPAPTSSIGASTSGCKTSGEQIYQHADTQDDNYTGSTTPTLAITNLPIHTRVTACRNDGENGYNGPNDVGTTTHSLAPSTAPTASWDVDDTLGADCATEIVRLVVEKRDAPDQDEHENKRYECSNSRVGVLVCRYGFCAIDFYCEQGMRCSDECVCCKDASVIAMETGAVA